MAQKKYTDGSGVGEIWLNVKNYVYSQLLGKADASHTHSASDISDVVTTNTTQNISSQKTITNNYHFDRRTNLFTLGVLPTSDSILNPTWFLDNNGSYFAWHQLQVKTDGSLRQFFQLRNKFLNGTVSNAEGSSFLATGLEYGFNSNGKQYFAFGGSLDCDLIPLGNQTKNIGSSSYKWNNLYVKNGYVTNLYINGTQFLPSDYATLSGLATVATSGSYNDLSNKPTIPTVNNATLTIQKNGTNVQTFTANQSTNATANITVPTKTSDLTNDSGFITSDNTKIPLAGSNAISGSLIPATDNSIDIGSSTNNIKMLYTKGITIDGAQFSPSDYIPRSGGAVMNGKLYMTVNNSRFAIGGGRTWYSGGSIELFGNEEPSPYKGMVRIQPALANTAFKSMELYPSGTWTWNGTACQITSDQRLKQQINQIDDKLLDAWEDVDLVQFKYNDAVDEKGSKARLHTGYVVQQIDSACKSHGVDVSAYGLYCHEEYPEETEEVEVEQADGTKTKETRVIREASEHYSLRYTEALIVECKYLRRCIARLTARIEELEKGNNSK